MTNKGQNYCPGRLGQSLPFNPISETSAEVIGETRHGLIDSCPPY
jgi:hypothetical protein